VLTRSSSTGTMSAMAEGRPCSRKKSKDSTCGVDSWRRRFTSVVEGRWPLRKEGHVSRRGCCFGRVGLVVGLVVVEVVDVDGCFMFVRWWW